ncbi:D-alanyl-D-alanine carboxypeptidase family protein [Sanguibacter sp. HDW7]|uniref:M15 family metallopeptidase n=1 Tax=Sanguibacter sp. HDW7 TaxID=2714931 RepID=UPI0014078717|nr:D-alanyl-D-alanine carboxypeptidase family protein [Sanguibacter sp. HDW7]QIK82241.1 M15 family metallopeptidase [Sanguibacter sp. HDW7]
MRFVRRVLAVFILVAVAVGGTQLVKSLTADADSPPAVDADNGRLSQDRLTDIGDGYTLRTDAAKAYAKLRKAARKADVTWSVNSAYRDHDEQVAMVEKFGLLENGGRAAAPGTSEHGLGLSVDLTLEWEEVEWMREHAGAYGFAETIPEEPWHWTYQP